MRGVVHCDVGSAFPLNNQMMIGKRCLEFFALIWSEKEQNVLIVMTALIEKKMASVVEIRKQYSLLYIIVSISFLIGYEPTNNLEIIARKTSFHNLLAVNY